MDELNISGEKNESLNNISNEEKTDALQDNIPSKKKLSISDYKAGMNIQGMKIKKVFFYSEEKEFIIIKAENDNDIHVFGGNLKKIEHLLAECKYLTSNLKNKKMQDLFIHQIAIAMNSYMLGETETSKKILTALLNKLYQREVLTKKLWYIGVFLFVTVLMICISAFSNYIDNFLYSNYLKIATFGAIGGFISLNIRLQDIKFEVSESTINYIMVSIYKVVFAMLSSIISYFLIESELILGIIKNNNSNNNYFIYAIATLAGFSESLLPNIFKSIEKKAKDSDMKVNDNGE